MDGSSSSGDQTDKKKCQCLSKVSNFITGSMEKGFYRLVKLQAFIAKYESKMPDASKADCR